MRVSAKSDYAVRAAVELAANGTASASPLKGERLAATQGIPLKFLENILVDLRVAGLVNSRRGPEGGYWLAHAAEAVTIADVIRAIEGPLASVRGDKPEDLHYAGSAEGLRDVWVALRASIRDVLERVTLADVASGDLPDAVVALTRDPSAWQRR